MKILLTTFSIVLFGVLHLQAQSIGTAYKLLEQGKFPDAIKQFTSLIQSSPNDEQLYYGRAFAYFQNKEYNLAKSDAQKAISLKNTYLEAIALSANSNFMLKDYQGSVADLTKGLEISPTVGQFLVMRGELLCTYLGNKEGGCKDLNKAKSLGSKEAVTSLEKYCNESKSSKNEMFGLNFPPDEKWGVADRQETDNELMLVFLRQGEDLKKWQQMVNMMQMKGLTTNAQFTLDSVKKIFVNIALKKAPESTVKSLQAGSIEGRDYIMFVVESPYFENDKNPESQLYFILQGKNDIYACSRSIKSKSIPKSILDSWVSFFKSTIIKEVE